MRKVFAIGFTSLSLQRKSLLLFRGQIFSRQSSATMEHSKHSPS